MLLNTFPLHCIKFHQVNYASGFCKWSHTRNWDVVRSVRIYICNWVMDTKYESVIRDLATSKNLQDIQECELSFSSACSITDCLCSLVLLKVYLKKEKNYEICNTVEKFVQTCTWMKKVLHKNYLYTRYHK